MNKEKNASDLPSQRLLSPLLKVLVWIGVVSCVGLLIVVIYRSIGFIPASPDAALLPTAEYLYAHLQPTLEYVAFNKQTSAAQRKICYWPPHEEETIKTSPRLDDFPSSLLFVNGSRVPPNDIHVEINMTESETVFLDSCVNAAGLSDGLHLVELHLKANPWDTPIIYQWAVMVE